MINFTKLISLSLSREGWSFSNLHSHFIAVGVIWTTMNKSKIWPYVRSCYMLLPESTYEIIPNFKIMKSSSIGCKCRYFLLTNNLYERKTIAIENCLLTGVVPIRYRYIVFDCFQDNLHVRTWNNNNKGGNCSDTSSSY